MRAFVVALVVLVAACGDDAETSVPDMRLKCEGAICSGEWTGDRGFSTLGWRCPDRVELDYCKASGDCLGAESSDGFTVAAAQSVVLTRVETPDGYCPPSIVLKFD